jgi:hypothetical protein
MCNNTAVLCNCIYRHGTIAQILLRSETDKPFIVGYLEEVMK